VGCVLRDGLARLRDRVGDLPYNLVFHTLPHHHDNEFHWHVHLLPRVSSVVGFEQGTGVLINIVGPEAAADLLR
jgi:UDPglucose--hexose-1-phosphate uridylyltransferase